MGKILQVPFTSLQKQNNASIPKMRKFQAGIFHCKSSWTYRGPVDRSENRFKTFQQIQKDSTF